MSVPTCTWHPFSIAARSSGVYSDFITTSPTNVFGDSSDLAASSVLTFDDASSIDAEIMGSTLLSTETICLNDGICTYFPNPDGDPGANLGDFNGQQLGGTWTVCAGDSASTDTGTLQTVQLMPAFN